MVKLQNKKKICTCYKIVKFENIVQTFLYYW
jgi:hypothetical protein